MMMNRGAMSLPLNALPVTLLLLTTLNILLLTSSFTPPQIIVVPCPGRKTSSVFHRFLSSSRSSPFARRDGASFIARSQIDKRRGSARTAPPNPLSARPPYFPNDEQRPSDEEEAGILTPRSVLYASLATAETVFWYWLAPGIDPSSRWFAPSDGALISALFDPSIALSPPRGIGAGILLAPAQQLPDPSLGLGASAAAGGGRNLRSRAGPAPPSPPVLHGGFLRRGGGSRSVHDRS